MTTVGLIVNPIAGMGGSVGLKGTDGEMVERARELGAEPVTPERTATFLAQVEHHERIAWWVAPGSMGADHLRSLDLEIDVMGELDSDSDDTAAEDTRAMARKMLEMGIDLLVFVGGDGTARDIHDAVDAQVPVVAVPAGVKVYSGAFALSPRAAAGMVDAFVEEEGDVDVTEAEVLDIDEAAFRADRLDAEFYGYLLVPNLPSLRQPGKEGSRTTPDTQANKQEIAASVMEEMDPGTLYFLGPGTTVKAIADELGVSKTLLGIDAIVDGDVVREDLAEAGILDLLDQYPRRKIVVTPLGGSGFIFGRGNKPFTPEVLRRVRRENIIVVATEQKMHDLGALRVDTGDPEVDDMLSGYMDVIIGYDIVRVAKVYAE